jgi:hypothetical protein
MCLRHVANNLIHNDVKNAQNACKTTEIIISSIPGNVAPSVRFLTSISKVPGLKLKQTSKFCDFPPSLHF